MGILAGLSCYCIKETQNIDHNRQLVYQGGYSKQLCRLDMDSAKGGAVHYKEGVPEVQNTQCRPTYLCNKVYLLCNGKHFGKKLLFTYIQIVDLSGNLSQL